MKLHQPPKYLRSLPAKGIKAESPVDRTGGDYGAGLIRGYAVITRGEALGHGLWIDHQFLSDVTDQINTSPEGHKSRFTHPGLSGDGLAKFLGRTKNAAIDGDTVRADLHFSKSAHHTPDGDLAGYLLDRAEEDPASFGASIVYEPDVAEEDAFVAEFGADQFVSPDPLNIGNLPHARLSSLRAVDAVDDPAANPNGFFHRQDIASEAEALVAYSLGLSHDKPIETQFGIDADRVQSFITRFLNRHGLSVVPQHPEASMPEDHTPAQVTPSEAPVEHSQNTGQQFLDAFGDQGGIWFAQGKSFDDARQLYLSALNAELETLRKANAELQTQLTASRGEAAPISFQAELTAEQKAIDDLAFKVGSTGLAKFAAGIKRK
jgi:hypothetical protein